MQFPAWLSYNNSGKLELLAAFKSPTHHSPANVRHFARRTASGKPARRGGTARKARARRSPHPLRTRSRYELA